MDTRNAIEVERLTKDFRVYHRAYGTLKAQTMHVARRLLQREKASAFSLRRALDDVSFEIPMGQTIALLGHNGSGKSTLLSVLTRIYLPTLGEVRLRGRVSSLLELGVGFNPELTGIENVFFSCTVRGMSKQQIAERYESIKSFAELDDDTLSLPVRMYSSGMEGRLAFSVAIHQDADILLIDEGLAVGDIHFQQKCLARMRAFRDEGKTMFLVTHNAPFVREFADRALWLHHGKLYKDGPAETVAAEYLAAMTGHGSRQDIAAVTV